MVSYYFLMTHHWRATIMQRFRGLLLAVLVLKSVQTHAIPISVDVVSTFDTSLEGWTGVTRGTEVVFHSSMVGNPAGSAYFVDGRGGGNGAIRAPDKFLGDWSGIGSLIYEHKIIYLGGDPRIEQGWTVKIEGGGGAATFVTDPLKVQPSNENWVEVVIPIVESQWQVNSGTWQDLISDVSLLDIEIELVFNGNPLSQSHDRDQDAIDNVRLVVVPVPSTLALLFVTGLALLRGRLSAY